MRFEDSEVIATDTDRRVFEDNFMRERNRHCKNINEVYEADQRSIIELLRGDHLPSSHMRGLIADELETYWWPQPRTKVAGNRAFKRELARLIGAEVDRLAEKLKDEVSDPYTEARERLAPLWGHESGMGLEKWLSRWRTSDPDRKIKSCP